MLAGAWANLTGVLMLWIFLLRRIAVVLPEKRFYNCNLGIMRVDYSVRGVVRRAGRFAGLQNHSQNITGCGGTDDFLITTSADQFHGFAVDPRGY